MQNILLEIAENITVIFVLIFVYSLLRTSISTLPPPTQVVLNGSLLGGIAVIGISFPIIVQPGIFYDGRGIVIGIAALFGGWRTGLVTALIVIGYRMTLGGAGIAPTILASALHVVVGAAFYRAVAPTPQTIRAINLFIAGIGFGCNVLIANGLLLPQSMANTILATISLPLMITYPLGTLLTGSLLKFQIQQHELRQRLSIGNAAIKYGDDGILIVDLRINLVLGNRAAARMLGYPAEDSLPIGTPILQLLAPHEGVRFTSHLSGLLMGTTANSTVETIPLTFICVDGSSLDMDCAVALVGNGMSGFVLALRDMRKFKQAEEAAVALALEQQKVQILRGFIGDASHDLRTPLTVMSTSIYLLNTNHERIIEKTLQLMKAHANYDTAELHRLLGELMTYTTRTKELFQRLERNIDHLNQLVDDLLNMAQIDRVSVLPLHTRQLNMLIAPIISNFKIIAEVRQQTLMFVPSERLPLVEVDDTSMERILQNLLTNAIKYTPEGGSITLGTLHEGNQVVIEVTDTGIGIPSESLPHIFDRFFRVDKARSIDTGGSGLGLSIVKRLVELQHGTISVESREHEGTTFRVMLPAVRL